MRRGVVFVVMVVVAIGAYVVVNGTGRETVRKADARDIHAILAENPEVVLEKIDAENVEVSLPLDGNGPRVLVRVEKGHGKDVPETLILEYLGEQVEVLLEVDETYELYKAQ